MATNPYVNKVVYGSNTIIDISDTTAVASDVASGKYFYLATGEKVEGTSSGGGMTIVETQDPNGGTVLSITGQAAVLQSKSVTPSEMAQTVEPDMGYNGMYEVSVGAISPTYVGSGVDRQAAQTITPSTVDQMIGSGKYLTGAQTIEGDADLVSSNIKSGASIFGVSGSSTVVDVSSTTATAGDVAEGKVFISANGTVTIGTATGGGGLTILKYGSSTWAEFLAAYQTNSIVYCRASSNANPATGSQTRLAFMAYVNNETNPTNVEFQYYRSVNAHSATQQGDQVYVYKLDKTAGWTVTVRECYTRIVAGTGLTSTWSNGVLTISLA